MACSCGLTFELSGLRRQAPLGRGRTIYNAGLKRPSGGCQSGSALERGVRRQHALQRPVVSEQWRPSMTRRLMQVVDVCPELQKQHPRY